MAYYRRRNRFPWLLFLIAFFALGAGSYLLRHSIERRVTTYLDRLKTVASPAQQALSSGVLPGPTPTYTVSIETPVPLADVPDPGVAASAFLQDWSNDDYAGMYDLLTGAAKGAQTKDQFIQRYQDLTAEATIVEVSPHVTSIPLVPTGAGNGSSVQVPFSVEFKTVRVGSFAENNSVPLVLEAGQWRVDWRPSLFFKDLADQDHLHLFALNPRRGSILDRKGRPLATMSYRVTIGVVPKDLKAGGHEDQTLGLIGQYLHQTPDDLKKKYASQPPEWYIPLGDVDRSLEAELQQKLGSAAGVVLQQKPIRVYPEGQVASHVVGYVGHITEDELKTLAAQGYTVDDWVGRTGVEQWGESLLAGTRGGKLAVVAPTGEVIKVIAQRDAVPGDDLYLTIDLDVQKAAEKVLGNLDGSVIVMDPQDNSVEALASYPNYDPNNFVLGWKPADWAAANNSPDHPFQNRPTESVYASGSIFKPITLTAAMATLGTRPTDVFDCSYWWYGLPGFPRHNWQPQGNLTLIQSITGSCDPTFYTLGLALYHKDPNILPKFARGFGLGSPTGINGVDEVAGTVPDPAWKLKNVGQAWYPGDSVILAIGQSFLQVTPIQMANAYSAIAMNGDLRSPVLVAKAVDQKGKVVEQYAPKPLGKLPATPEVIQTIHAGMLGVTSTPLGTAYYGFQGYKWPMEAKTGSAENQGPLAHAWFVGYASPDKPDLLILVMIEGRGDSHGVAVPIARSLMDILRPNPAPSTPTPVPKPATPRAGATAPPAATPTRTGH